MRLFSILNLRARLLLFGLLAMIPAFSFILYTGLNQQHLAATQIQQVALRFARLGADNQRGLIDGTRQLLAVLAQVPSIRDSESPACHTLLTSVLQQYPQYMNLGAVNQEGILFCSARPLDSFNLADHGYIQQVLTKREFAMGNYQIDRMTHAVTLDFGYPILVESGAVHGVIFATLNIDWLKRLVDQSQLPSGSTWTLVDEDGTVLARYPNPGKWIGQLTPEINVLRPLLNQPNEGLAEGIGEDGLPRFFGIATVENEPKEQRVYVSIPQSVALDPTAQTLATNLAGLAIFAALVYASFWAGGEIFILHPIYRLMKAARQLGKGDLSERTGLSYEGSELGRLAQAFDEMAGILQARQGEAKQAEFALRESEERYRKLVDLSPDAIAVHAEGRFVFINPAGARLVGAKDPNELVGKPILEVVHPDYRDQVIKRIRQVNEGGKAPLAEEKFVKLDGTVIDVEVAAIPFIHQGKPATQVIVRDITERKHTEEEIRQRAEHLAALNKIMIAATEASIDLELLLEAALDVTLKSFGLEMGGIWLTATPERETVSILQGVDAEAARAIAIAANLRQESLAESSIIADWDIESGPFSEEIQAHGIRASITVPLLAAGERVGGLAIASPRRRQWSEEAVALTETIGRQLGMIVERTRLFAETRQRLLELEAVNKISTALRAARTLREMMPILSAKTLSVLNAAATTIWLYDLTLDELHQVSESGFPHFAAPLKPNQGIAGRVLATGQLYISSEFKSDPLTDESTRDQVPAGLGGVCAPIRAADQVIGVFFVSVQQPRQLTQNEINLLMTVAEIAGNAIYRTRLHERTEENLRRLAALHAIDVAITSSSDSRTTFNVILDHVTTQLQVDAAAILIFDPHTQMLEYGAERGFRNNSAKRWFGRLGESLAGRAVLERRAIYIPENIVAQVPTELAALVVSEGFMSYYGIPLITKGEVKGVLEIFHRRSITTTPEWVDYIEMLAEQTAIAVDSAALFADLQHSNMELSLAYDTTLEGWSRALDLRDKETEGHTERVTEMTLQLSRALEISESDLIHIRRGALLHDIGKMSVPDRILFKAGELTEEEWQIMRKHPVYAYDMLAPIAYLRPALDIPYCHHEKWDGMGYPRGLKKEQIPLAARIFAVVDVWDALRSDRPYRPAWPEDQVHEYIRANSGIHFDPKIVDPFLTLVGTSA